MAWIIAALILGIFLNMSTVGGHTYPIGSVVAIVIIGIYIKVNQDKHFAEIKHMLEQQHIKETPDDTTDK